MALEARDGGPSSDDPTSQSGPPIRRLRRRSAMQSPVTHTPRAGVRHPDGIRDPACQVGGSPDCGAYGSPSAPPLPPTRWWRRGFRGGATLRSGRRLPPALESMLGCSGDRRSSRSGYLDPDHAWGCHHPADPANGRRAAFLPTLVLARRGGRRCRVRTQMVPTRSYGRPEARHAKRVLSSRVRAS